MSNARVGGQSPWGQIQHVAIKSPDVVFVSTAGHGGFWLSAERHRDLQRRFPFPTYAGGQWYEEDCDAAVVVCAFPELFEADRVSRCAGYVSRADYFPDVVREAAKQVASAAVAVA